MRSLRRTSIVPWAPHAKAAPMTERQGDLLCVASNGTRFCVGGWQVTFEGVEPGRAYDVVWRARFREVAEARDCLRSHAYWSDIAPDSSRPSGDWHYLLPEVDGDTVTFRRRLKPPEGTERLTLRCTFRWTERGEAAWEMPRVEGATAEEWKRSTCRVAVVTGSATARKPPYARIADNTGFYLPLCEKACLEGADLVVLPEIALQWQMEGHAWDLAVPVTSDATAPFARLASEAGVRILVGLFERDQDAVHNSAALFGPGGVEGVYRKVHLAVGGESESGVMPGSEFPVWHTPLGKVGCNICMDSSAAESSRMAGLNGAEILLLPIMGDHRADRWSPGRPIYSEDRWRAIMRTHAMDNQVVMAVARNTAQGSCVVDRKGDFLAWNDGDRDVIVAEVNLDDGYRTWNGGCFREVNWMQRRPHLYDAFADPANLGALE